MKVLKEICLFSGAEFVLYTGTDFLVKTKEDVRLLGMDGKVKARRALPVYVSKIIRGRDGTFLLLPSLFAKEAYHMSGDLKDLETIPLPTDSESYLRDGCFLVDGSFLLLAEEKTGSYLLHCRKDGDVFVLFRGDGHRWTGIRFSEFFNSAILFLREARPPFWPVGVSFARPRSRSAILSFLWGKGMSFWPMRLWVSIFSAEQDVFSSDWTFLSTRATRPRDLPDSFSHKTADTVFI